MKSVKEINAIIRKLDKQITELENKGGELLDNAKTISHDLKKTDFNDNNENFTTWKTLHNNADDLYKKAAELKKVVIVWNYNLLHAKKAELLPIWAGVMKEYQGKQIGRARDNEIREKLKALGVTGYISQYEYSSPKISLSYLDENGYTHGLSSFVELTGDYNIKFFDLENKFNMPNLESFKFYGENIGYIDNPKQYINKLEKLANKAKSAAAVYNKALHDYNAAAVPGFAQIDYYKDSPASIAEYFRIKR